MWCCLLTLRHPTGGSFLRPGKVSFGIDYVTVVREQYGVDVQAVLSEKLCISSRTVEWLRLEAPRYDGRPFNEKPEESSTN